MPAERLSMRQIREVLRLCYGSKLPQRAVARSLGLSQGAVSGYLSRARAAGIAWPLAEDIDDARLEGLLFPPPSGTPAAAARRIRFCRAPCPGVKTISGPPTRARSQRSKPSARQNRKSRPPFSPVSVTQIRGRSL